MIRKIASFSLKKGKWLIKSAPSIGRKHRLAPVADWPKGLRSALNTCYNIKDSELGGIGSDAGNWDKRNRIRSEERLKDQNRVLEMITEGKSLSEALDFLIMSIERHASDHEMKASILLLDDEGKRLLHGSAPSLPEAYNQAIDGIAIGEHVGSCGRAAFTKKAVIVSDIKTDVLWKDFKDLAISHNLRSCWSTPILSEDKVLGTFALYYNKPHTPTKEDRNTIEFAKHTAALVIIAKKREEKYKIVKEQLELTFENIPSAIYHLDKDGNVLYLNKKGANLMGYSSVEEVLAVKDVSKLREKLDSTFRVLDEKGVPFPRERSSISLAFKTGKPCETVLQFINRNSGSSLWLLSRAAPMLDQKGEITTVLAIATDITFQKNSEQAIRQSENRLRHLTNSLPLVVWTASPDGNLIFISQQWENYYGNSIAKSMGMGWTSFVHPDDLDRAAELWKQSLLTGNDYEAEFRVQHKSGKYHWILVRAIPAKDDKGAINIWHGSNTDIQDKKEAEKIIFESESRFQNLIHTAPVGIILLTGENSKVEIVNNAYGLLIGRTPEELLGRDLFTVIPEAEEAYRPVVDSVRMTGEPLYLYDAPYEVKRDEKTINGYLNIVCQPYRDSSDAVIGALILCQDVTESVMAKKALQESETRFRTLAETLPQMIWMQRIDRTIEYASENWEKYTGIKDFAEAWKVMTHPDDREEIMHVWEQAIATNSSFRHEVRLKNKSGEYRWHSAAGEPIRDEEGNVVKWIGVLTDIQEQKTFSDKLESLVAIRTKELGHSNEDLQQFAHVASHDLKEPIRKIKIFLNLLESRYEEALPEGARLYIKKVQNSADRMKAMIEGVLLYSSLNSYDKKFEKVDLGPILESIQGDLEVLIKEKKAVIEFSDLPQIEGIRVLIYQLFYNLINNSLKFSSRTPVIKITSKTNNSKALVEITVKDNGIGFSEQDAARIFETFIRLHSKDLYEGSGIGLALCKKIVERHKGTIIAKGKKGEGATFTITLPIKHGEEAI
ncbi:MAG: PAS domain S-box protein [Bacteroidetes bacterium]|nr:PAS domain S-box protein [Bacteroidota bacterium]